MFWPKALGRTNWGTDIIEETNKITESIHKDNGILLEFIYKNETDSLYYRGRDEIDFDSEGSTKIAWKLWFDNHSYFMSVQAIQVYSYL